MKNKLLLFTISFPYTKAAETTFIKHELPYLIEAFNQIIIIPEELGGEKEKIDNRIVVDKSLSDFLNSKRTLIKKFLNGISLKYLFVEFLGKPKLVFQPRNILRLLFYIDKMKQVNKWFKTSNLNEQRYTLIYTYWFTSITSSFLLYTKFHKVISRVHGGDLYEDRHNDYIPLRKLSLKAIKNVYCVSEAGMNYLQNKYPSHSRKFQLARLGTKRTHTLVSLNSYEKKKNKILIVSCSALIPLKRVELIVEGLEVFSETHNIVKIEWVHFGNGPLFNELKEQIGNLKNRNLCYNFKGEVKNEKILEYYRNNHIDIFITTSSTEGGVPVTLQEAQSFGIPCIGTNVGGIPEIINEKTGLLISENPTPNEIEDAIGKIYNKDEKEIKKMRLNCYNNWEKNFNSDINFKKFAEEIKDI